MRYSKLFGKTIKDAPADAATTSHKLLHQGGFIRESTSGRYFMLPLGMRVQSKIIDIIRQEMNKAGAQEMIAPVLHPLELWQETNRTHTAGFELMIIKDRRGAQFALGGTAEEMMVDVVRKFQLSYKDLPFQIYQFSQKFRDELRARGGLLRVREFLMKDGYSFHQSAEDFEKEYQKMAQTYQTIFKRLGLETHQVLADNGYIGGEYCHEFVVENPIGESRFLMTSNGKYIAHEDVAGTLKENQNLDEPLKDYQVVEAKRGTTMADGVKLHKLPLWQQLKDVLYVDDQKRFILALLRGDFDVNEVKLMRLTKSNDLRPATNEEIREELKSEPGFISPVGLKNPKLIIIADDSLNTVKNLYGGANEIYKDALNINYKRDFQADIEGDIAMAKPGHKARTGESLIEKRGIEVGNIFQLGYHYSKLMKDAVFTDAKGKLTPYYMGCYGIGVGRSIAAIAEIHHDDKGIIWPKSVAPFDAQLITIGNDAAVIAQAEQVYQELNNQKIEVLWDDRNGSTPGEKFADADLIGNPYRIVISPKTLDKDQLELSERKAKNTQLMSLDKVIQLLQNNQNV